MRIKLIRSRESKGYNQANLAKLLGISRAQMSRLESEKTDGTVRLWDKLERILGVPQQELRESDGWRRP
jgi:transcriptional regulator with XRE-family HTH domain